MIPFIETKRLYLFKVTSEFCTENYLSWLHDKEVNKYLDSGIMPQTIDDLVKYVNELPKTTLFLAIVIKETNKHIGNIKIDSIDYKNGRGELGTLLGDRNEWGKGYAKEASLAIFDHCFYRLNLRKITMGVVEENIASCKLYEKIGFKIEGIFIKHGYYDGAYRNIIKMALFKEDYEQK